MSVPGSSVLARIDRRAIADSIPLFLPAIPFGFVLGLAATEGEMPAAIGWSTSPLIFGGAAQLAVLSLAGTASIWAVIVAGLVINTRHVMYSAAMAPIFQHQPRWMRWMGPFVLIDQVFALSMMHADRPPREFRRYYLTCGLFFFVNWQWATALGMVVGPVVPDSWQLGFAPPIMFLGLVLAGINKVPQAVAATVGGVVGLVTAGLQDRLGILIGAIAGVIAGAGAELYLERAAVDPAPEVPS
jgi:predicted branched-subunit amino acid permease